jgi:hypothetical protein
VIHISLGVASEFGLQLIFFQLQWVALEKKEMGINLELRQELGHSIC